MVAQPAAEMAAVSSSGEEPAPEMADDAMRPHGAWATCHNALAEAHCAVIRDGSGCGHEVNALGDDSYKEVWNRNGKQMTAHGVDGAQLGEMGRIVGDWFQTAEDCRLSIISDKIGQNHQR